MNIISRVVSVLAVCALTAVPAASAQSSGDARAVSRGTVKFDAKPAMVMDGKKGTLRLRWSVPDRKHRVTQMAFQTRINDNPPSAPTVIPRGNLLRTKKGYAHRFVFKVETTKSCAATWPAGATFTVTLLASQETKPGTQVTRAYRELTVPVVCR